MTNVGEFEQLHLDRSINTINTDYFPNHFDLHWHNYVEIAALPDHATIKENPVLSINQKTYQLSPGDLLFIWPGELHEIVSNPDNQCIGLQFASTLFHDLPDFRPYLNLFRTIHHIKQNEMPDLAQHLMMYLQYMMSIQEEEHRFPEVETLIHLYEMFMKFASYLQDTTWSQNTSSLPGTVKAMEKVHQSCDYIIEHCNQPLTLDDMAAHAGFSACYFSRIFKKATTYSFIEYLTLQRVKRAQELLGDPSLAITEISYQAGFKSISTFNRVFHQYKGCSPSEYRKYYIQ